MLRGNIVRFSMLRGNIVKFSMTNKYSSRIAVSGRLKIFK
jgi:hypothetical protein